jgi:hypothetical protein
MDETTSRVYRWLRDNLTRPALSNQAIRKELRINSKYIRRAKAIIRAEDVRVAPQKRRNVAIERAAAHLREWGVKTEELSDYQILHLAAIR